MNAVTAAGWGWRYAGRSAWAVHDLDLTIEDGERVLLLGPSGAGKSTLLRALAGVLGGADEGEEAGQLLVGGQHPTRRLGQTGLVQQDPASQVVLARVGDDVAFGLENQGLAPAAIWPRVAGALSSVGLPVPVDRLTSELSGGQQQRLVLAGALARGDRLLLLDEPTASLDPAGVTEVRDAVGALAPGTTLVIVEHRVDVWLDVVSRIVVLGDGGVIADGTPADVLTRHGQSLADQGVWVPGIPLPVPTRPPAERVGAGGDALRGVGLAIGYRPGEPVATRLDVAIPAGRSTVITGPNGAGKSTLALTLAGLLPPLEGRVEAAPELIPEPADRRQRRLVRAQRRADESALAGGDGTALAAPHAWRSAQLLTRLGMVFQQPEHQFVAATVRDELAVGLRALHWPASRIAARVDELLDALHLEPLADVNPFTLSGGEKRRLSVGTVLASGPSVIVLDEPTFGQDRSTWCDLVALIAGLLDQGRTVISVTHDQAYIDFLSDHRIDLGPSRTVHQAVPPGPEPGQRSSERIRRQALDRLNPVARLLFAVLAAVPVLITLDWVSAAVMLGIEAVIFTAAGVRPSAMARALLPVLVVALVAGVGMALYGRPGGHIYWHWWLIVVSTRSLLMALAVVLRILALALAAIALLRSVDPTAMADGLAQLAHLPARFVLGTLAGVRLLGLLADDWRSLSLARRARGLGDTGTVQRLASMAFTLLVTAIRRATTLATAMEVRGFGGDAGRRTWARPSRLTVADAIGLAVTVGAVTVSLLAAIWAGTFWLIWLGVPT